MKLRLQCERDPGVDILYRQDTYLGSKYCDCISCSLTLKDSSVTCTELLAEGKIAAESLFQEDHGILQGGCC